MSEFIQPVAVEAVNIERTHFWQRKVFRSLIAGIALTAFTAPEPTNAETIGFDTGGSMRVGEIDVKAFCDDRENLTPNLTSVFLTNRSGDSNPVSGTLQIGNDTEQINTLRNGGTDNRHVIKLNTKADNQRITFTKSSGESNSFVSGCKFNPNAPVTKDGYWMLYAGGDVSEFGIASRYNDGSDGNNQRDIEGLNDTRGYWIVNSVGEVAAGGTAVEYGDRPPLVAGEEVTSLSGTPSDKGYWLFTNKGRVIPYGDAGHFGDMSKVALNGPVSDSVPTPTGKGYYMVASDGGVFTFGDANFAGSMGDKKLNKPVESLVPDADKDGYWLVASDGGIFAFNAEFYGSMGGAPLNRPVTGMVGFPKGYMMVGEDGGIFTFGDAKFRGSDGDEVQFFKVVAVDAFDNRP